MFMTMNYLNTQTVYLKKATNPAKSLSM